ncbi:HTTM domain-containing protein [Jiulongibacter sediminis]|uniref:HTTM-like domain-containing protein n=1 Tax=Jiulongibacter sediminis TaxID=1605367 RepID=A0A0P7BDP3_9BACT|nr:HTTM domain-containing protein [Jiulongibacter sediminis]KPM48859.1 hypothetical protein AFM12_09855 [Jiulongibacter sediminis]TBX25389.1 hypothetical protein TK44_09860 [Jiulongibacter sediminis]
MKTFIDRFLWAEKAIYPLATFRVVFGLLMAVSTARFMYLGWIDLHFVDTKFQFKYFGFEWVKLLPPFWMHFLHWVLLVSAILVALGLFYRVAIVILFFVFTYLELIDSTYYLNHYYFMSLVAGLMMFIPANRWFSLDVLRGLKVKSQTTNAWHINILKFQILILYCYAGLAKINEPWLLEALPLKIWLPASDKIPLLGSFFAHPMTPYVFSWTGMLYDTFIVFFLMYRPTRLVAYFAVIVFHSVVGILFQIGVFPVVMMGITLIFFSDSWHLRWQNLVRSFGSSQVEVEDKLNSKENFSKEHFHLPSSISPLSRKLATGLLLFYIAFQLLFPWRYLLHPGSLFWREEGYRFSWRVMLMEKAGTATFFVKDGKTGREGVVDNREFLNPHQEKQMAFQPDMILQYAHFLGNYYHQKGVENPEVRVEAYVTLNAKPSQLLIDPSVDLMNIKDGWLRKGWLLSLTEEFPD